MIFPPLYPILDFACFAAKPDPLQAMLRFSEQLLAGGATLLQYRGKISAPRTFLANARELRRATQGRATFMVNDVGERSLSGCKD